MLLGCPDSKILVTTPDAASVGSQATDLAVNKKKEKSEMINSNTVTNLLSLYT
jgi:hypothetical protein